MFTRLYKRSETALPDSKRFRIRLLAAIERFDAHDQQVTEHLRAECGLVVDVVEGYEGVRYGWADFVNDSPIDDLLDAITGIYNGLRFALPGQFEAGEKRWLSIVRQILEDEHLAYRLDDDCVVHPLVDTQFEEDRVAVISALGGERYRAALQFFERAIEDLEARPPKTRGVVRSCFECAENLFKLLHGGNADLDRNNVKRELQKVIDRIYAGIDEPARQCAHGLLTAFCNWVDAGHKYRHANAGTEPADPPMELTVAFVSTGAGFIRWLAELDRRR